MAAIRRFEDIEGWKKSLALYEQFSKVSSGPSFKSPYLQDQMERSVDSAMSNIAEGFDSGSNPEFVRFLRISFRSLSEFQSHLYVCKYEQIVSQEEFDKLYEMAREAKAKVGAFIRYLLAHPRGKWGEFPSGPRRKTGPHAIPRASNQRRTPSKPGTLNEPRT